LNEKGGPRVAFFVLFIRMKSPEQIRQEHEAAWMALPNVIGTGIGEDSGRPCILIFVSAPHEAHRGFPSEIEGCPVNVVVTGLIKAEM
jgi:hypothetical protein